MDVRLSTLSRDAARAARRSAEGIEDSVEARDLADSMRVASPLKVADDAMVIDSSYLSADEVVARVVDAINWKQGKFT